MNIKIKCEGCRNQISPELYEENDGLCSKCKTRVYPADCFDPRKDMQAWWVDTGYMTYRGTSAVLSAKRVRLSRGYTAVD